jgi:UDP-2,3-diacylglucosamine hydrolase
MGYKRMKKYLQIRFLNGFFVGYIHIGVRLAQYLSVKNKLISGDEDITFLGEDKEWLILYSKKTGNQTLQLPRFGHRHLPMKVSVGKNSEYVNLGDWITYFTYGVLMGKTSRLKNEK